MNIIISIGLIIGGLALILYKRTKAKDQVLEVRSMQTKKVSELFESFKQMDANGLGADYREYVEIKGKIVGNNIVETPFSNRRVAYCESELSQVTETREQYRDSNGHISERINKTENTISKEKSSQDILINDSSTGENVVIELNAVDCNLDIPKTFDRFEPRNNLYNYRYFNSFSMNNYGPNTLGFKMVENTINENQDLYVIGEAYRVGDTIHIGKPLDGKKPFIVTTKSEEELVNSTNKKATGFLIGGIALIIFGIMLMISSIGK